MHHIGMQSMGDKENEEVIQNWLNLSQMVVLYILVYLIYFPCPVSIIPLYNGVIYAF